MRVLLLKDVYKLGRAGDVKKVADGYGRNYLLPHGLAALATPGALKQVDRIRQSATDQRVRQNQEMGAIAERLNGLQLVFPVKAGETGKLFGSITPGMLAESIQQMTGAQVDKRQIDCQPIKAIGIHKANVRLTIDLIPSVTIVVHREGEAAESAFAETAAAKTREREAEAFAELQADLDATEKAEEEAERQTRKGKRGETPEAAETAEA
jgi:large subunit ribosomal protein L9